jgi:uncharacterized membrane protein
MDKFLISTRKIEPVNYTFYTVVMGLVLLVIWPWVFFAISTKFILLDLLSGAVFSLAMYVFFTALSKGEVSRVIPYIFGLVPVFDLLISFTTGHNALKINEFAAVFLLIPGALLVSHHKGDNWAKHAALKTLSAFLFSAYYAIWQYASQSGHVLNDLMWNRIGAAGVLIFLLIFAKFRKKVFSFDKIEKKKQTSVFFIFKQILGGANFIFLSFLFVIGKIPLINALQGFRYIFLLIFSFIISKHRGHIIKEIHTKNIFTQKTFGILFIFIGTILLFADIF